MLFIKVDNVDQSEAGSWQSAEADSVRSVITKALPRLAGVDPEHATGKAVLDGTVFSYSTDRGRMGQRPNVGITIEAYDRDLMSDIVKDRTTEQLKALVQAVSAKLKGKRGVSLVLKCYTGGRVNVLTETFLAQPARN